MGQFTASAIQFTMNAHAEAGAHSSRTVNADLFRILCCVFFLSFSTIANKMYNKEDKKNYINVQFQSECIHLYLNYFVVEMNQNKFNSCVKLKHEI